MAEDRYGMNWTTKCAKIKYSCSREFPSGELPDPLTPISVDSTSYCEKRSRKLLSFALEISHKNYLHCKFIDTDGGILVHDRHTMSFTTYIFQNGPSIEAYVAKNVNNVLIAYYYVPQIFRKHIKSMIKFIYYLHDNKISLAEFSIKENLLVHDGILKFWKLEFVDATPESRKRDFQLLSMEIRNILFNGLQHLIPLDMADLLQKMITHSTGKILLKHISLLSSTKRVVFFKGAWEKQFYFVNQTERAQYTLAQNMGFQNWYAVKFSDWNLCFGPIITCLNSGPKTGPKMYEPNDDGLLKCCRDLATHLLKHFTQTGNDFDIDMMISQIFLPELMTFQENLNNVGILDRFI